MDHPDHVYLLRRGVPGSGGVWADLGAGDGAFTLALADLIGPRGVIYAVDKNGRALRRQRPAMAERFPRVTVHYHQADFTQPLDFLPPLDGIVMANALHFVRSQAPVLQRVRGYLRENGRLLVVEYNVDRGNPWVPHPFSYTTWTSLAQQAGFSHTELLATQPSRFLGEIYAAASW